MLGVPLVIVVLNNGGWEAIKDLQLTLFGSDREIITGWKTPDGQPYFADVTNFARSLAPPPSAWKIPRSSPTLSSEALQPRVP